MSPLRALVGEDLRLEVLSKYGILDTAPEQAFDELVKLTARCCGTPIALVSILDAERQWFKAGVGIDLKAAERRGSLCDQTIRTPELLVVNDTATETRFECAPRFPGHPPVRFYAGVPLMSPEGTALGTLCVMGYEPRTLDDAGRVALRVLGDQVMSQLELRRRNGELAGREQFLFTLLESEPESVLLLGKRGRIRRVNPAAHALLETGESVDALNMLLGDFVPDAFRDELDRFISDVFGGETTTLTLQLVGLRGALRWVHVHGAPLRDDHGVVMEVLCIARDMTERRDADDERKRLMQMVQHLPEFVAIGDLQGNVQFMNAFGRQLIGLSDSEDLAGLNFRNYVPDQWRDFFDTTVVPTALREGRWEGEMQLRHLRTNALIDVHRTMLLIRDAQGRPAFFGSILRDISARLKAEQRSRESEERYRSLFQYAPDGIIIADNAGKFLDVNDSLCRMLGRDREELIGLDASVVIAPEEHANIGPAIARITAHSNYEAAWRFKRKDATVFDADVIATTTPEGHILAMVRDVTDRKRADARLKRLIDSNAQGVMFWDLASGNLTYSNEAFLSLLGYTQHELASGAVRWINMTPPEWANADRRAREQLDQSGRFSPFEKEFFRKDGGRVPVLIGGARFQDSDEEGVCFVVDLTERKKLEQQYLRAQRMESIGTLAGGIAHDLNNVLGPIVMAVDLLKLKRHDADAAELLELVQSAAIRGSDMVRQVLSFSRGLEGRRMEVQIRHLIRDIEKIITETLPKNIDIRVMLGPELWTVHGDPTQLHQVLMNLCVNARDAMPDGGRLTISAQNHPLDAQYVAMNPESHVGPYVLLQVEDNGTGMSAASIEKAFDPFFTTKEIGKGTGLGLSTSMAIVKSHDGFIRIYSELGKGTSFKVYLPAEEMSADEPEVAPRPTMPRGDGELILVVDDEASIRQITQQTLEAFGYKVVTAVDGADAIATFASRQHEIAAIVTDMMMPVLGGPETIRVLRKLRPDCRIVAVSGLAGSAEASAVAQLGVKHFLPKPYTAELLLNVLYEVLHEG